MKSNAHASGRPHATALGAARWALAVVAYEALTAKLPFDGASLGAICVAINACQFKPVSSLNRQVPPEIDRWFA